MNKISFPLHFVFPRKHPDSHFCPAGPPRRVEHRSQMAQQESLPLSDVQPWDTLVHRVETGLQNLSLFHSILKEIIKSSIKAYA